MSKDVKKHLLEHSAAKVKLLGEYIARFLNIISNDRYTEKIHVYDLFCGEGQYEDGGLGSPLVIMNAVKDIHFKNVAKKETFPKINCQFNDIETAKVDSTSAAIAANNLYYSSFGDIEYSSEDYLELIPKLTEKLSELKNEKAFVFIDPYGYKHIRMQNIIDLMSNNKTEVLLWLPTQFMYRFESNGTPTALKDFIEELVPYQDWTESTNVWTFVDTLKNEFQNAIGDDYFVDNFTIEKDANTVFCLYFFTSHIKGFEKMLESKWKIDDDHGKGWSYQGNQGDLFAAMNMNPLEEKLMEFLNEPRTNGEIFEFTLRCGYLSKHSKEILSNLQKQGNIKAILEDTSDARKNAFYLNYKCYKEEYSKITVSKTI